MLDLAVDQASGLRRIGVARPPVRAIAVTSGKGGVGKTNVSVNLSMALAARGRSVMLRRVRPLRQLEPPMEFTSTSPRTRVRWSWAKRVATPPPNEWPTTMAGSSTPMTSSRSATHWA